MVLGDLIPGGGDTTITGFAIDHRKVAPGSVFGAFMGARVNGEDFIDEAVKLGAVAVVARPEARAAGALHIADADPRARFAALAAPFFAPFPDMCVAVTGTNGKTSCVELTRQLWLMAGHRAASIGTLGITLGEDRQVTGLTTPDVVTFLGAMGGLAREGVSHVAFEASSHGLDQRRVEGLPVRAAAFTNFSRDHLDYHGTMEAYFAAKLRLFSQVVDADGTAVVWTDDPKSGDVIAAARARGLRLLSVGRAGTTLHLLGRTPTALGQTLIVRTPDNRDQSVKLPLIGAYQAANALTAAGLVIATGGDPAAVLQHLTRLTPVRGRLEHAVITRAGAPVYVDYAHTPDALEAVIEALRPHAEKRLIVVFGAGGDRDPGKRGPIGAVVERLAESAIVTDANPPTEDAAAIRAALLAGAPSAREIADRREAIRAAMAEAGPGDLVLIAGKGHETGQIVGERIYPFDDVAVAREGAT